jgi:hypothetical protein
LNQSKGGGRHGSKSRDVGRVSLRSLGRLLARREEVGQQFSVTRERIRQIEVKALRKRASEPVTKDAVVPRSVGRG